MELERYRIETRPLCPPASVVKGERWRVSVLTSRLLRLEYSETGAFEDRPTQMALFRDFAPVEYRAVRRGEGLELFTEHLHLRYDGGPFTPGGLTISMAGAGGARPAWRYGMELHPIGGTARTLDGADGDIPLQDSLFSWEGCAVLDDSRAMALTPDGWVAPHAPGQDLYFFGYDRDFEAGVADFYHLCGPQPLLPRYALGGWWSRFYRYTQEEYLALMERFVAEDLPFTVAVVDMDWHLVDIDPALGTGWTGYTWNRQLFPDPEGFAGRLHEMGMKMTLNVHPADGVRAHEECYPAAAKALGRDPEKGEPIDFDAADPAFLRVYFDEVHRPLEKMGNDFWWIDWQQGSESAVPGLDPLWVLNHYHFLDSGLFGRRPLTLTRYAGPGSHRYPVGFSGDTYITWASLRFQPYFTASASNIGFGWWSHDIGGHMGGRRDDELAARWVQFGVFSPVFRLHCMSNRFSGKEPWNFGRDARAAMEKYIRLRHALLPYLYSMNHDAHFLGRPLIRPVYWLEPQNGELYSPQLRNEYAFGSQLLVCPVTDPADPMARLAKTKGWLPAGLWFDFFTGLAYEGGRMLDFYRPLEDIPVLAKAGAILPLQTPSRPLNSTANPASLTVHVFPGGEGAFTLWEDDGDAAGAPDHWAATELTLEQGKGETRFSIAPARGNIAALPPRRRWTLFFRSVEDTPVSIRGASGRAVYRADEQMLAVELDETPVTQAIELVFPQGLRPAAPPLAKLAQQLLMNAQTDYIEKDRLLGLIERKGRGAAAEVLSNAENETLRGALLELLLAQTEG